MKPIKFLEHYLKLLLLVLMVLSISSAQAQVEVDLTSGKVTGLDSLEDLSKGDTYRVVVKGVNLNLYKVTVEGTDTVTSKAVVFPTFAIPGLSELSSVVANIGALETTVLQGAKKTQAVKYINSLSSDQKDWLEIVGTADKEKARADSVRLRLSQFAATHDRYNDLLRELKTEIDAFLLQLKLRSLELRSVKEIKPTGVDYLNATALLEKLRTRVLADQKVVLKASKELADYSALPSVKKIVGENDDIAVYHKKVTENLSGLVGKYDAAFAAVNATTMDPILEQLNMLEGNYSFTYTSIGFQYKGGDGKIKVSATPISSVQNLPSYSTTYRFPLKSKRYVGVSAAFYASGMYNQAFSTITGVDYINEGDTTDGYLIKEEDVTKKEIGAAALFTYGGKFESCPKWGGHLAVGPAVSLSEKVRPRLFIGGGLSLGKEHMVMLNVGYMAGFTERRSVVYPDDGPYEGTPGDPTVNKLTGSWCFTLGYLFKL